MRSRSKGWRDVSSEVMTYVVAAAIAARNDVTWKLNQNRSGRTTPTDSNVGPTPATMFPQKLPSTIPTSDRIEPVSVAAQAAAVVPFFQYNPPMMTAPAPAVNIPPVISHHRLMYFDCVQ